MSQNSSYEVTGRMGFGIYSVLDNGEQKCLSKKQVEELPLENFIEVVKFEQILADRRNAVKAIQIISEADGKYELLYNPNKHTRWLTEEECSKYEILERILQRWKDGDHTKVTVKSSGLCNVM